MARAKNIRILVHAAAASLAVTATLGEHAAAFTTSTASINTIGSWRGVHDKQRFHQHKRTPRGSFRHCFRALPTASFDEWPAYPDPDKIGGLSRIADPAWHRVKGRPRGGLYQSKTSPSPPSLMEDVLKWSTFGLALALMSFGFKMAAGSGFILAHLGISASTWLLASMVFPGVAVLGALNSAIMYGSANGGGEKIVKQMGGIESNDPTLYRIVDKVHSQSGLGEGTFPRIFVVPDAEPNAFAAGTGASIVAVTTGLVDLLNANEVQGVVAHEVGHVRNQDCSRSVQTAAMLSGLATLMSVGDILTYSGRPATRSDDDDDESSLYALGTVLYLAGIVSYALGFLVRAANSRSREFEADAFAKSIGAGPDLASALRKLESHGEANKVQRQNGKGLGIARGAFATSYIDNPPSRENPLTNLFGILRSHPTTAERIKRLLE